MVPPWHFTLLSRVTLCFTLSFFPRLCHATRLSSLSGVAELRSIAAVCFLYPARAVPSTMADIQQQPTYDNLGRDARDPGVQPVPLSRSTRPALIQLVQLALSIATSSVFIVTVDFTATAVNNSLTAARLLVACAGELRTATCALSVACVARAKTFVAFGSAPESPVLSPSCSSSPPSASPSLHRGRHQSPQSRFSTSSQSTAPAILRSLAPPHQHSRQEGRQDPRKAATRQSWNAA